MKQAILADYSLIGNSRSAALVSKYGSIDWCWLTEFHSPSIFAALLDRTKGGYFSISPVGDFHCAQKYMPDTNVLETNFKTADGEVRLLDAFTAMTEQEKSASLFPDHEILRIVEGVSGSVKMILEYVPKVFYGMTDPDLKDRKKLGISFSWKENLYTLNSTLEPQQLNVINNGSRAEAEFSVRSGQRICFSLS